MRVATLIPVLAALLAAPAAAQPPCPPIEPASPICERFSGLISADGLLHGRVVMRQWQIANDTTVEISHRGFLIVHLRAGALVAEIGDKHQEWGADSFWSVAAGKPLIVHTARDSAVLQTVDFITQSDAAEEAARAPSAVTAPLP